MIIIVSVQRSNKISGNIPDELPQLTVPRKRTDTLITSESKSRGHHYVLPKLF